MKIPVVFEPAFRKVRVYVGKKIRKSNLKDCEIDSLEPKALAMCRMIIRDSKSRLLYWYDTNKRCITNKDHNISIIIKSDSIDFCDGHYQSVPLSEIGYRSISRVFDSHVAETCKNIEVNMRKKQKNLFILCLIDILNQIKKLLVYLNF